MDVVRDKILEHSNKTLESKPSGAFKVINNQLKDSIKLSIDNQTTKVLKSISSNYHYVTERYICDYATFKNV